MPPPAAPPTDYVLPAAACASLADPKLRLVLHGISFSHYVERARWALRLLGLPYEEVSYLPLLHMPGILGLQRQFKQGAGPPTASSKSPAATPCLAIYAASGQPLCLLQDSALICRYAVLRAAALRGSDAAAAAADLYGSPALSLIPSSSSSSSSSGGSDGSDGSMQVAGGAASILELEARLGGTLGIEVRRVMYHNLLPLPSVGGALFSNNSKGSWLVSRLVYYACRLLLPKLLRINAATAAKGKQRLLAEWDYLDSLLVQQQRLQGGGQAAAGGGNPSALPFYLSGNKLSIADIQLACLAGPLLCIPNELNCTYLPPTDSMPADLQAFVKDLQQRPTGKFVLDMWRVHGPKAKPAAAARM